MLLTSVVNNHRFFGKTKRLRAMRSGGQDHEKIQRDEKYHKGIS